MRFLIGCLFFSLFCNTALAGTAQVAEQVVENTRPKCQRSVITPTTVVTQQQVIMVPQRQTIQVERTITEYVPQTRTEIVEQEVCVMVPQVVDVECVPQQECYVADDCVPQQQCVTGQAYRSDSMTDKERAMFSLQNAIDDMEIAGERAGKVRRAKRVLARLAIKIKNEKVRGGY